MGNKIFGELSTVQANVVFVISSYTFKEGVILPSYITAQKVKGSS